MWVRLTQEPCNRPPGRKPPPPPVTVTAQNTGVPAGHASYEEAPDENAAKGTPSEGRIQITQ